MRARKTRTEVRQEQIAHGGGSAIIVVTHDHRSLDIFDRTYEMEDGELRPAAGQH